MSGPYIFICIVWYGVICDDEACEFKFEFAINLKLVFI